MEWIIDQKYKGPNALENLIWCLYDMYKITFIIPFAGDLLKKPVKLEPSEIIFGIDDDLDVKIIDKIDTIANNIHHIDTSKLNLIQIGSFN